MLSRLIGGADLRHGGEFLSVGMGCCGGLFHFPLCGQYGKREMKEFLEERCHLGRVSLHLFH